jgi:lysyl endopeptidase
MIHMKTALKLFFALSILAMLTACGSNTSDTQADPITGKSAFAVAATQAALALAVDAYRPPASSISPESPLKPRDLSVAPIATNIALGAPQDSLTTTARKNNETAADDHMGKPLQIGFGRDVAQTATALATNQVLKWQATKSGGQVAAINFSSTGAKGMRVGVLVDKLPAAATLRFYAKGEASAFEIKGANVLAVLAANLASGDKSNEGRTFWSPVIKANNGTLEIEIPVGTDTNAVQVSIPIISHFFMSSSEAQTISTQSTYDGNNPNRTGNNSTETCQIDVTCITPSTPALPAASDAVAWLIFNRSGGYANICSGTLLNDNINSATPYLLTANHCISTQTTASTLYTEFKYRSLACNNAVTGEYYPTTPDGASLLYTAAATDSTLLKLNASPSTSVLYAGWDATVAPATSTVVHSIHHPQGDQQRLSRGSVVDYWLRSGTTGMSSSNISAGTILGISQSAGNTEPGSSGSGLFKGTDANPVLIGQLFGRLIGNTPADSCLDAAEKRIYGRFDVAYNAGMSDWLNQGIKNVTQFYNTATGIHYYAYGVTDSSVFSAANQAYSNQGTAYKVSSFQTAGLSPVHKFYNTSNGTYFYTISEKERAAVASNTPRMRYDGVVWYASATLTGANSLTVYSAFNKATGSQFFTTSLTARNNLIAANSQFIADGIAFYVAP